YAARHWCRSRMGCRATKTGAAAPSSRGSATSRIGRFAATTGVVSLDGRGRSTTSAECAAPFATTGASHAKRAAAGASTGVRVAVLLDVVAVLELSEESIGWIAGVSGFEGALAADRRSTAQTASAPAMAKMTRAPMIGALKSVSRWRVTFGSVTYRVP